MRVEGDPFWKEPELGRDWVDARPRVNVENREPEFSPPGSRSLTW